jgi:hypothetical protein
MIATKKLSLLNSSFLVTDRRSIHYLYMRTGRFLGFEGGGHNAIFKKESFGVRD